MDRGRSLQRQTQERLKRQGSAVRESALGEDAFGFGSRIRRGEIWQGPIFLREKVPIPLRRRGSPGRLIQSRCRWGGTHSRITLFNDPYIIQI